MMSLDDKLRNHQFIRADLSLDHSAGWDFKLLQWDLWIILGLLSFVSGKKYYIL